jgi:hypothetical protein
MKDCPTCLCRQRRKLKALSRDLTLVAAVVALLVMVTGSMAAVGAVGLVKLKAIERGLSAERR